MSFEGVKKVNYHFMKKNLNQTYATPLKLMPTNESAQSN